MAYTALELEQIVQDKINAGRLKTWKAQDDISFWRGLSHKKDKQLVDAIEGYKQSIKEAIADYKQRLDEMDDIIKGAGISVLDYKADIKFQAETILRLADKYWAVKEEIEGRQKTFFVRQPIGTTYYIDLNNGSDDNDGTATTKAYKTIEKYTMVTVRSVGDIAWIRAGTTETKTDADITNDEAGTQNARISLKGCSIADDPWNDGSDVKPILDFGAAARRLYLQRNFWHVKRLVVRNSIHQYPVYIYGHYGALYEDMESKDHVCSGLGSAFRFDNMSQTILKNPIAINNENQYALYGYGSRGIVVEDGSLDGKATVNSYGIFNFGGCLSLKDVQIGQIQNFSGWYWYMSFINDLMLINCKYATAPVPTNFVHYGRIYSEDDNQVKGAHVVWELAGEIRKDTSITRTGGATSSARLSPSSYCGLFFPLVLGEENIVNEGFGKLWLPASQKTITVYVRSYGTWTTYPTADELYLEASYYSETSGGQRATIKSTQVLSDPTTWVGFSVTLTPQQEGFVYLKLALRKYEAANVGCFVDVKPVVS